MSDVFSCRDVTRDTLLVVLFRLGTKLFHLIAFLVNWPFTHPEASMIKS